MKTELFCGRLHKGRGGSYFHQGAFGKFYHIRAREGGGLCRTTDKSDHNDRGYITT